MVDTRKNLKDGKYTNKVPYSKETRQAYRNENDKNAAALRSDLEEENGMVGHPKALKLWDKAWMDGHSEGYYSVIENYEELLELVK